MNVRRFFLIWMVLSTSRAHAASPPKYESDIRPIFKAMCFHCHGEEPVPAGGLDMRLVRLMKEGGDSGEAITGENPDESLLWLRIESDEMPEGADHLAISLMRGNWRMKPLHKQIRDGLLMGTGLLKPETGGPSVPVARGDDGKVVIGILNLNDGETDEFSHHAIEGVVTNHDWLATVLHQFGLNPQDVRFKVGTRELVLVENSAAKVVKELLI